MITGVLTRLGLWLITISYLSVCGVIVANAESQTVRLDIRRHQVVYPADRLQVRQGDRLTLRWTSDETVRIHLHGYDLETIVKPQTPAEVTFRASRIGRFSVVAHGFGVEAQDRAYSEVLLMFLEVLPRLQGVYGPDLAVMPRVEQPEKLLMGLEALAQAHRQTTDVQIRSPIICHCPDKAPHTIRQVRRAASEWFAKGLTAFAAGNYETAIVAFSRAIQLHPREARAYINRGIAYAKIRNYQRARTDLVKAIELDDQQAEAYYAAGLVSVVLDDRQQAQQDFLAAIRLGYEPAAILYGASTSLTTSSEIPETTPYATP